MKNWLKRGVLKQWTESKNPKATFQGRAGEEHEAEVMMPFGFSYCPPADGAEAVLLPVHGNNDHLISPGFTGGKYRPKAQEGGLVLYTTETGQTFEMPPNGSFLISTPDGGFFNIADGKVTTNMTIETTGDIIADGVSLKQHIHGGVETGGGLSGTPES